jgi:hypothetical protein
MSPGCGCVIAMLALVLINVLVGSWVFGGVSLYFFLIGLLIMALLTIWWWPKG